MSKFEELQNKFKTLNDPEEIMDTWYSIKEVHTQIEIHKEFREKIVEAVQVFAEKEKPTIDAQIKFSSEVNTTPQISMEQLLKISANVTSPIQKSLRPRRDGTMKRLLIVDGLNLYMRNYNANPSISTNGDPIGGCKGFLASLQRIARITNPDKIVVVWDGEGGSKRKRSMVGDYKSGRKPVRLNRMVRDLLTPEQELHNRSWQYERTISYLNNMPVHQIRIDGVEADDVISYVNMMDDFSSWLRIIVSTDKDFYQCVSGPSPKYGQTIVFRPKSKGEYQIVREKDLIDEFGIHPCNFVIARAMDGDKSDNLPGVPGVGLKTVSKRFPFLSQDKEYELHDIYTACEKTDAKAKIFENILKSKKLLQTNYNMMQLSSPNIPVQSIRMIKACIREMDMSFNKTAVISSMISDGFGAGNWDDLFAILNRFAAEGQQ